MILWAFLNCYSRIYLGVHYPGDILAGLFIGFLASYFAYRIFILWSHERPDHYPLMALKLPTIVWLLSVLYLCIYAITLFHIQ